MQFCTFLQFKTQNPRKERGNNSLLQTSFAFACNSTAATPTKANQSDGGQLILRFGLYLVSWISWLRAEDWGEGNVSHQQRGPMENLTGMFQTQDLDHFSPSILSDLQGQNGQTPGTNRALNTGVKRHSVLWDPMSNRRILKGTLVGGLASLHKKDHTVRIFITSQRLCQQHLC